MFLKRLAKTAIATAVNGTGARAAIAAARRAAAGGRRVVVLGYHRVCRDFEAEAAKSIESCLISQDSFRAHVRFLSERFELATMSRAVEVLEGRAQADRDVAVITFDDGYRDVLTHALPVLREFRAPATVYVSSGVVARAGHFPHDRLYTQLCAWEVDGSLRRRAGDVARDLVAEARRKGGAGPRAWIHYLIREHTPEELDGVIEAIARAAPDLTPPESAAALDWDGVRALAASGLEIGAHTVGHAVLTHCSRTQMGRDLEDCRVAIEREVRRPVRHFAYCNGYYSPALIEALRANGFTSGVTTEDRLNHLGSDAFRLGRRVVWEGSARGAFGRVSPALAACVLDGAWTALGFDASEPGERADPAWIGEQRRSA